MDKQELGSETAKSGFKNEDFIATEFSKGEKSKHAKKWLTEMGYDTTKITKIDAKTSRELGLGSVKSDVIVFVNEDRIGISAKKAIADFNQIDKRWTDTYQELLKIPNDVVVILKKSCQKFKRSFKSLAGSLTFKRFFKNTAKKLQTGGRYKYRRPHKTII